MLVLLLASCVISPKEKDVYDIKVTIKNATGNRADFNGTYYINSTEVKTVTNVSDRFDLYTDEKCTTKAPNIKIIFGHVPGAEKPYQAEVFIDESKYLLFSLKPEMIKSVSTAEMVFNPGSWTTTVSNPNICVSFEIVRETSFALTEAELQ